jgi:hypothetical protein
LLRASAGLLHFGQGTLGYRHGKFRCIVIKGRYEFCIKSVIVCPHLAYDFTQDACIEAWTHA